MAQKTELIELVEAHNIAKALARVTKAHKDWKKVLHIALTLDMSPCNSWEDRQKMRETLRIP